MTDFDLSHHRCATCGGKLVDGSYQPGIDVRFATAACRGTCSPDESKIMDPSRLKGRTRVPVYLVCREPADVRDRGTIQEEILPCLLPFRHSDAHSPTFRPLTVSARLPAQRKPGRGDREEPKMGREIGRYTELIPGMGDGRPAGRKGKGA